MTEADWLNAIDPKGMLEFLQNRGATSERKFRLFAIACCRRIWHRLNDERSRYAVELAERSADESISEQELDSASGAAEEAFEDSLTDDNGATVDDDHPGPSATSAASYASAPTLDSYAMSVVIEEAAAASLVGTVQEALDQAALLRDIAANLFAASPRIDEVWLTWNEGLIKQLAEAAYQERALPSGHLDPDRLAVLADALEEVGADTSLLEHLRSRGPHVRGCFVIDCLTGRQ